MKYAYEDLYPEQFELLVVLICQKILGISVQGFSKGPDGGRDAKFVGTAELHPSKAAPWVGTVIIQAKHTNGYNKTFSDSEFFSKNNSNSVIGKEIQKIKLLRNNKQLDHYMLFSNRRLSGNSESIIRSFLSKNCDLPETSIYLCGIEQLELYLKNFNDIPAIAKIDPIYSPLIITPDELSDIVEAFATQKEIFAESTDHAPTPRVSYNEKNIINEMSIEYANSLIKKYLKDTKQISTFLSAPENNNLRIKYEDVIEEFQLKIIAKRKDHLSFDDVMNYILQLLFDRDPILARNKRLTKLMLFYMYWNCDIGKTGDD